MTATNEPPRLDRRGRTLVEMAILISCLGVLLTVTGRTVFHVGRATEAARAGHDAGRALGRLHRTLRDDARTATGAAVRDGELLLALPGDITVRYRAADGSIRRERLGGDVVEAGDTFPVAAVDVTFAADGPTTEVRWNHAALAAASRDGADVRIAVRLGGKR